MFSIFVLMIFSSVSGQFANRGVSKCKHGAKSFELSHNHKKNLVVREDHKNFH